ncbi:early nodulin-like protein 7 [Salvia miltiorrhiza]|uniref:early nodulin-like protein 7 n=1 Tax=Salvia miltiorrhiza TaxID=226208 RepID=UPI0025ACA8EA|nr:early nodulin-like protein 7 [Salvia miltiorrhiza]
MASTVQKVLLAAVLAASVVASAGLQFEVGDEMGWAKPTGKERETYNEWATQNRFHIRDTLHFKYAKDSVVVVSSADYLTCNASNPIAKFEDGSTVYELNRPGFFYFISDQPAHCKSGQRLIVRVMHPLQPAAAPELAPELPPSSAPTDESGGDSGWPEFSSTAKLCVASYFVAAFVALVATFYMFV